MKQSPVRKSTIFRRRRGASRSAGLHRLILIAPLLNCGCLSLESLPSQRPVQDMTEPRTQRSYLLYVPSTYSDGRAWPLVVVCHGTRPFDTAKLQMREWARFAENHGIIVVAPRLVASLGGLPPPPEKQIALQREDERAILAIVSAVKRSYNIAEEQVFMTGWSAAAYVILHTGLRHPDVFRALAIRQGTFDERFMDIPADRQDRWQRLLVIFGKADFLRDQSIEMIKWLRAQDVFVEEREIAGSHRRTDPKLPWEHFRDIVKRRPWIRIRAWPPDTAQPRTIRFALDTKPPATAQKWFFGDGETSYEAEPVHTYADRRRHEVTVNVALEGNKTYSRKRIIHVGYFEEIE